MSDGFTGSFTGSFTDDLEGSLTALTERVHATPHRMAMAFAGAGAQALAWLHAVGGSSRTVLEATDHYSSASLVEAVGFTPERFTSERVARALAERAWTRARALSPGTPCFGVGVTATIATDRDKKGEHRAAVAVRDALGVMRYQLTLDKGARDRQAEEALVSTLVLRAVAEACGLSFTSALPLLRSDLLEVAYEPVEELARLERGLLGWVRLDPAGTRLGGEVLPGLALLSGSFNPLHEGHLALARIAAEELGQPVAFELSLANADKPAIALAEARRRALQFAGLAPLLLSRAPRFGDKAALFPDSTFVLGADTAARLVAERFYGGPAERDVALAHLAQRGARFLVASRASEGRLRGLGDLDIPSAQRGMFRELSASRFRMDISSSEVRSRQAVP